MQKIPKKTPIFSHYYYPKCIVPSMRILLTLQQLGNQVLPVDYRYYLSAWIYRTIWQSNRKFAAWLHDQGYDNEHKRFKLFCYGDILQRGTTLTANKTGVIFRGNEAQWILSFYVDEMVKHLVKGVFLNQQIEIAGMGHKAQFRVSSVDLLPRPDFREQMTYRTLSPVMIRASRNEDKGADHLGPTDERYGRLLINNLVAKYQAYHHKDPEGVLMADTSFGLVPGRIRTKKHSIYREGHRPVENKGFHYSFTLRAPVALQEMGYYAGFGNSNSSLGFGLTEILDTAT